LKKLDIKPIYEYFKKCNNFDADILAKNGLFRADDKDIIVNFDDNKIELLKEIK
jgi:hypothetical protein